MRRDAPNHVREWIDQLERAGELHRVRAEVNPVLEIAEITDRVTKTGGPALLFERVKGSDYPVFINGFGTRRRMAMALGVERLDDIGAEIKSLVQMPSGAGEGGLLSKLKQLPKLAELAQIFPKVVRFGPCQEVVEAEPNLRRLPILQCWPGDGGRFITLPLVFSRDPVTGKRNVGLYRMHVYDERTTGMHWHLHKGGSEHHLQNQELARRSGQPRRLEVAVALGADPATIYAASAPLPHGIDEMLFAGFLRKRPVELVRCQTVDLEVPAEAEFILEGYVDPSEERVEGPFGDHTGFYSPADRYPVFHVTHLTRRRNPIYPTIIVGKPVQEDYFLGLATERIFLPLIQLQLPEVLDIHMPPEGVFHNCVLVRIKKRYPGQAKKVMHALWGLGQMMFAKLIVVVDEDTDVQDLSATAWRVFNNIDPRRDVVIVDGPVDDLDHASPQHRYGSKMGIDATVKWPNEGHPRGWPAEIEMSPEVRRLVDARWKEYGLA